MSSPKSRKYNEAGGDPWKYIYPALKWVEEYENVWKPKFGAKGGKAGVAKLSAAANKKVDARKLTEAVAKNPSEKSTANIPASHFSSKSVSSNPAVPAAPKKETTKKTGNDKRLTTSGKTGTKKTIVPRNRLLTGVNGMLAGTTGLANRLYSTDGFVDATDRRYLLQEEPALALDSLADDEEMQSLGFTTGENADLAKDMYIKKKK